MFISCSSCSTWKRYWHSSLNAFSVFEFISFAVSNRCCLSSPRFVFRSCKDTVATTNTWSRPMSAPRFALTSCSDLLHLGFTMTWSIWLTVLWSGNLHVEFIDNSVHKEGTTYDQSALHTYTREYLPIVVSTSKTLCSHGSFSPCVILSNSSVEVSNHH